MYILTMETKNLITPVCQFFFFHIKQVEYGMMWIISAFFCIRHPLLMMQLISALLSQISSII